MKIILDFGKERFRAVQVEDVSRQHNEVLIKVQACGICGTEKGSSEEVPEGVHLGHEVAGIVEDSGSSEILKEGDRVVLSDVSGCGVCEYCETGRETYCVNLGSKRRFYRPHGHSEKVAYIDRNCLKIPDDMSFETAIAVGGCGIGVGYHGIKRLGIFQNSHVCVFGVGPIGLAVVMVLKHLKAKPIAIDTFEYRLKMANEFGAEKAFNILKEKDDFLKFVQKTKIENSVLCTGNNEAADMGISCLSPQGKMVLLGGVSNWKLHGYSIGLGDKTILGSWYYNRSEWQEILALIQQGVPAHKLVTHVFTFEEVEKAYCEFLKGNTGKVVLKP